MIIIFRQFSDPPSLPSAPSQSHFDLSCLATVAAARGTIAETPRHRDQIYRCFDKVSSNFSGAATGPRRVWPSGPGFTKKVKFNSGVNLNSLSTTTCTKYLHRIKDLHRFWEFNFFVKPGPGPAH